MRRLAWLAPILLPFSLQTACFESASSSVSFENAPGAEAFPILDARLPGIECSGCFADAALAPAVGAIVPASWPLQGPAFALAVYGSGLAGAQLKLGGTYLAITSHSDSKILATVPAPFPGFALPGIAALEVIEGGKAVASASFTVTAPALVPAFPWPTGEDLVVAAALASGEWAVASRSGQIFRNAGGGWVPFASVPGTPSAIAGTPTAFYVATGAASSGTIYGFTGNAMATEASFAERVAGLSIAADGTALACGDGGAIWMRATSGGSVSWRPLTSGTTQNLHGLFTVARDLAYAVGDGGTLLQWNGSTWSPLSSGTAANLLAVIRTSTTSILYVGGTAGTLLQSTDSTHFTAVPGAPSSDVTSIDLRGDYLAGGQVYLPGGTALGTTGNALADDGASGLVVANAGRIAVVDGAPPTSTPAPFVPAGGWVDPASATLFLATGTSVVTSKDGATFTTLFPGGAAALWGASTSALYIAPASGALARWNGTSVVATAASGVAAVTGTGASDVYAWGPGGLWYSSDGATFGAVATPAAPTALADTLTSAGAPDVWFAAGNALYHGTATAGFVASGTLDFAASSMSGSGSTDVYAVGGMAEVEHYDGSAWSPIAVPAPVNTVLALAKADAIAVGPAGAAYEITGATVTRLPAMATLPDLTALAAGSAKSVWVISNAGSGALFHLAR